VKVCVVDASVAAKWLLPATGEDFVSEANRVLSLHVAHEWQILAPALIWAEIGNVLWKAVRCKRTSQRTAAEALEQLRDLELKIIPVENLMAPALEIAAAYDRSFYDSLYVALAVREKGDLITADERLANALAARFPVRWLGAFHE